MSIMKYFILILSFLLVGCSPQSSKMRKCFSLDKSFCIDIPIDFSEYYSDYHALIFRSQNPFDIIIVERTLLWPISKEEFQEFIRYDLDGIPQQFQPTRLVYKNDSICLYKYNVGSASSPEFTYTYYMRKDIGDNSYIVKANGLSLNDQTIKLIYNSIQNN